MLTTFVFPAARVSVFERENAAWFDAVFLPRGARGCDLLRIISSFLLPLFHGPAEAERFRPGFDDVSTVCDPVQQGFT